VVETVFSVLQNHDVGLFPAVVLGSCILWSNVCVLMQMYG